MTAAIVIGSIAPDVDAVLMPFGWDRYLLWHQRGTHAIVGTIADALLLALLCKVTLSLLRRWRRPRGGLPAPTPTAPTARVLHLALAAWLGCLGHITLDLVSGGTIRLFAPLSSTPFGVPWTAMADPLIAVPLLMFFIATLWGRENPHPHPPAPLSLSRAEERSGEGEGGGAAAPGVVAPSEETRSQAHPAASVPARTRDHARRFAVMAIVALAAIIGVKEISRQRAIAAYARATAARGEAPASTALEAAWASFTRWWAFDRSGTQLRVWEVDAWRGTVRLLFTRDAAPSGALVDASTRLDTVRHLHELFDLTFVEVRARGAVTDVLWSDIRFCGPSFCALWFGGTFDATGTLREQVVIVGTLRQTRGP